MPKATEYIESITLRGMGFRDALAEGAAMAQRDLDPNACPACRGRGWKLIRSRRAVVIATLLRGLATPARRDCPACDGTGNAG